ncbi:MAG: HEAT repeat protein [Planctomycetota bacterium]
MKRTIAAFIVAVTSFVFAQQEDQAELSRADFDKAVQVETMEGDLVSAVNLYARAADNETLDDITRTRARYRMGLIYRRLGQDHDADRVLKQAAKGKGPAAKNAENVLAGKKPQDEKDWSVQGRIHRSISKLYRSTNYPIGISELTLIGEPAVPPLVEAVHNEKNDLTFVKRGVSALIAIGGPAVASWIDSVADEKDLFYRRTVLDAIYSGIESVKGNKTKLSTASMTAGIRRFMLDPDSSTAQRAIAVLAKLKSRTNEAEVLAVLRRSEPEVVTSFLRSASSLRLRDLVSGNPDFVDQIATQLKAHFLSGPLELQQKIMRFAQSHYGLSKETAHHFYELMALAKGPIAQDRLWANGLGFYNLNNNGEVIPAAKFLAFANNFPKDFFHNIDQTDWNLLREKFPRQSGFLSGILNMNSYWKSNDVPAMIELLRLGASFEGDGFQNHLIKVSEPEQLGYLLDNLSLFSRPYNIANRAVIQDPNPAYEAPLVNWVNEYLSRDHSEKGWSQSFSWSFIRAIAHQRTPAMNTFLVELAAKEAKLYRAIANSVTMPNIFTEEVLPTFRVLLAMDCDEKDAGLSRFELWVPLYRHGDPKDIPLLVAAARKGLGNSKRVKSSRRKKNSPEWGCGTLPFREPTKFTPEQRASIFAQVIKGREEDLEEFILEGLEDYSKSSGSSAEEFSAPLVLMVADTVFALEDKAQEHILKFVLAMGITKMEPAKTWVLRALKDLPNTLMYRLLGELESKFDKDTEAALKALLNGTDDRITTAVLDSLDSHGDGRFTDDIAKLLVHQSSSVRVGAIRALVAIEREKSVPTILPLASDISAYVRKTLCGLLGEVPERTVVPVLVEALRDPNEEVRKAAEASLKRVQFYFDQKKNWDRFLNDAGLDATSAVSALLKQAKVGNDQAIRLIAIESLGTLGVAETLPILIQFMTEGDAEIQAAAKLAIDKINSKPAPKK